MIDDQGNQVKSAPSSVLLGWSEVPDCGAICKVVKNEREARREADDFAEMEKKLLSIADEPSASEESEDENLKIQPRSMLFTPSTKVKQPATV